MAKWGDCIIKCNLPLHAQNKKKKKKTIKAELQILLKFT